MARFGENLKRKEGQSYAVLNTDLMRKETRHFSFSYFITNEHFFFFIYLVLYSRGGKCAPSFHGVFNLTLLCNIFISAKQ